MTWEGRILKQQAIFVSESAVRSVSHPRAREGAVERWHSIHALLSNAGIIIGESVSAHLPSGYLNPFELRIVYIHLLFLVFALPFAGLRCALLVPLDQWRLAARARRGRWK